MEFSFIENNPYDAKQDGKMIRIGDYARVWKETLVIYVRISTVLLLECTACRKSLSLVSVQAINQSGSEPDTLASSQHRSARKTNFILQNELKLN
jgi:hypothetical protein